MLFFFTNETTMKTMIKSLPIAGLVFLSVVRSFADDTNAAPATPPAPAPNAPAEPSGPVLAPTNDAGIGSDGKVDDQDSYQVRIGELYAPGGEAYIMPLRLPTVPDGQKIVAIHFRGQLVGINNEANGLGNADLYSLGVRDTNKILPTDYYQGPHPDTKADMVQKDFLTPTSKVRTAADTGPFIEMSPAGEAALAKLLNDACAKPGSTGKFLILRVSYDVDPIAPGNNAYQFLTTGATGDNEPPMFTYTLGPK
jgi:hypothetical protein